jgi:polyphosphate kinase
MVTTARTSAAPAPKRTASNGRVRAHRTPQELFFNRELSWLDFNARVLEEAQNSGHPLLERLKFLAIFSNNLDEFFMVHVPGMQQRVQDETNGHTLERALATTLQGIKEKIIPLLAAHFHCFQELLPQLARHGIRVYRYADLNHTQKAFVEDYFERTIFPVLTPLAVDPGHPFPYISNLSLSLALIVHDPVTGLDRFARVKVPIGSVLPRLVSLGAGWNFVLLEEVIAAHIGRLFSGMEVKACFPFRVTRNADLELEEEATDDLMELIEEKLSRRRFGELVRLEITQAMPPDIRRVIMEELDAQEEEVYVVDGPLNMSDFFSITGIDIPKLRFPPFVPGIAPALRGAPDIFAAIRHGDVLLHHPYQSFGSVVEFLRRAAADPQVLAIKHTLYRTSGDSPILAALIEAADNGKQVACVVELKARFDEANNITWAKQLENSGVHVVYGLIGLKTHCKVTLVVRREEDGIRRYVHVGTGNYNPKTATIYTDIGLLTCNPEFGVDATDLFNLLTGYSRQDVFKHFLVAPVTMRKRMLAMIEREAAKHTPENPGRIIAKMNSLVDLEMIRALYAASQKGVQIDLIIRGMCCLRPGIEDLSENIRVMSIVGRFLEHSRIFYFRNGGDEEIYIGSADWMARNLDRRIEVIVPIRVPALCHSLRTDVLELLLKDNCQSWDLQSDGRYIRRHPFSEAEKCNAQMALLATLAG